jgi:Carboxypeptidase regulatory-like domain
VRLRLRTPQDAELGARIVGPRETHVTARVMRAPRATLKAHVVGFPGGKPVDGAILELVNKSGDDPFISILGPTVSPFLLRSRTEGVRWLEMPGGQLYSGNIPAGPYELTLYCRGYEPYRYPGLVELPARTIKDLGEIKLEPGAKMCGRVLAPDGRPVAGARVLLGNETHLYLPRARNDYHTDADGLFEIAGVGPDRPQLVVAAEGYAPTTVCIRVPEDLLASTPRTIHLVRGATVQAKVLDRLGDPQRFRLVVLVTYVTEVARDRTDEHGIVQFTNLTEGVYQLRIHGDIRSTKAVVIKDTTGKKVYQVTLKPGRRSRPGRRGR